MTPTDRLANLDAARERFAAIVDSKQEPAPVYRHAAQLGWLMAQAHARQMPAPDGAYFGDTDWQHVPNIKITFDSLAALTAWAQWADAVIEDLIGVGDAFLGYGFTGAINEVRVDCMFHTRTREVSA